MGLFDGWRRKKHKSTIIARPRDTKKIISELAADESMESGERESITNLLGEYENLVKRREALSIEREDITKKLERREIEATDFRKELMSRIQEAAKVSENLKEITVNLTQLGYRGTLQ